MNRLTVAYLLLLLPLVISAQKIWKKGGLLHLNGDTLIGQLESSANVDHGKVCYFRQEKDAVAQVFTPAQLKGFFFDDGRVYLSKCLYDNPYFYRVLARGKIDLYCRFLPSVGQRFYVEKNEEFMALKNTAKDTATPSGAMFVFFKREYIEVLTNLMSDVNMQSKIERARLREASLTNLINQYNTKKRSLSRFGLKKETPLRMDIGLVAGINSQTFVVDDVRLNYTMDIAPSYFFGLGLKFRNVTFIPNSLNLNLDIILSQYALQPRDSNEPVIKYQLNTPVYVQYQPFDFNVSPHIEIGMFHYTYKEDAIIFSKLVPFVGMGASYKISQGLSLVASMRYEFTLGNVKWVAGLYF